MKSKATSPGRRNRSMLAARCVLVAMVAAGQSACSDEPEPQFRLYGDRALLAAGEPGSIVYQYDYQLGLRDVTVAVLSGDADPSFGFRHVDDVFGTASVRAILLGAAPAGTQATLELRYRERPLGQLLVEFAAEGDVGLRTIHPVGDGTASEDLLGALCVLERAHATVLITRRAADGRWLDAAFPDGSHVSSNALDFTAYASLGFGGIWIIDLATGAAGAFDLVVTTDEERVWNGLVRVVSEDELVTLDVQTPTEDGVPPGSLVTVLRTADGCPVVGADITLEVDGRQIPWSSGWNAAADSGVTEGVTVSAAWGGLVETAVY